LAVWRFVEGSRLFGSAHLFSGNLSAARVDGIKGEPEIHGMHATGFSSLLHFVIGNASAARPPRLDRDGL
jgi:hypothetical protein